MEETVRYFAKASGRVQGVGFRMYVRENASKLGIRGLGIRGWVMNMSDGTVDMEVQGPSDKVDKLFEIIQAGNYFIKVTEFHIEKQNPVLPPENGFLIKY